MAVGDDAASAGFPLVPDTGENGKVKYGAREINATRDMVAGIKLNIPRKITSGPSFPANPQVGDIHFRVV